MRPLQNITVFDLTQSLAGPYATLMLADAGANVLKIEPPDGDPARTWEPTYDGQSLYYAAANRGKSVINLDLKNEDTQQRFLEALTRADILVENFRPEVMKRIGLDYTKLRQSHPKLIIVSITGYGPNNNDPAFDHLIQGESGLMHITGQPDVEPTRFGLPITDILAGMNAAYGALAALNHRQQTGEALHVNTSLLASAAAAHVYHGARWLITGQQPERNGNHSPVIAPYGNWPTSDGWITIAAATPAHWKTLANLLNIDPELPEFADNKSRVENHRLLYETLSQKIGFRTSDEWIEEFKKAGIPAGRINNIGDFYDRWPELSENGLPATPINYMP
jgi:formyl-CoA transferase